MSEKSWMRRRIVAKSASASEYVLPAEAPQFQFIDKVGKCPFVARSREVVDAGITGEIARMCMWSGIEDASDTGETNRMGAWSEVGIKSCYAGLFLCA